LQQLGQKLYVTVIANRSTKPRISTNLHEMGLWLRYAGLLQNKEPLLIILEFRIG
jgi:hypothetical protein